MAGTAKNIDVTKIQQGPGDLWLIPTAVVPADAAAPLLVLAADGTPDAAAQPGCKHLGATKAAITTAGKATKRKIEIDQVAGTVYSYITGQEMTIEAELAQHDLEILQHALGVGFYSAGPPKYLGFGGKNSVELPGGIACIAPMRSDPAKFRACMIFKAEVEPSMQLAYGRSQETTYKVKFDGLTDPARVLGPNVGYWSETT